MVLNQDVDDCVKLNLIPCLLHWPVNLSRVVQDINSPCRCYMWHFYNWSIFSHKMSVFQQSTFRRGNLVWIWRTLSSARRNYVIWDQQNHSPLLFCLWNSRTQSHWERSVMWVLHLAAMLNRELIFISRYTHLSMSGNWTWDILWPHWSE